MEERRLTSDRSLAAAEASAGQAASWTAWPLPRPGALAAVLIAATACDGKLPLGHPDLEPFRGYEQPPSSGGRVTAQFLGTSSILFRDSETAILSDGFVTRPGLASVLVGRVAPDTALVRRALDSLRVDSIAAIFTGHSHYDHAMDAPTFARRTGAILIGSPSTANIGRGGGLPERQLRVVRDGEALRFGKFTLTFIESRHARGERYRGTVDRPLAPPARAGAWRTGTTWSVLIEHHGRTLLVHGSANYKPGALRGRHADVVYLGIGGLGKQPGGFVDAYWNEVVRTTGAKRVILVHWDDFFRTLDKPLRPMPYAMDSFTDSMRRILRRAAADSVEVLLPVLWQPTDPFAGLDGT
jgi:L-ascorbate metabolism protein UlaG (beta-lactamase superfamily)